MTTLTARPSGTVPTPAEPGPDVLAELLEAGAHGDRGAEAAVALLVGHGHWLTHGEFLDAAVHIGPHPDDDRFEAAYIDHATAVTVAGQLHCSLTARCVLFFAAELAGVPSGLSTAALLRGMGAGAARIAIAAAKHTAEIDPAKSGKAMVW